MERVVMYLYPDEENASAFKIFQDRTNQIKAFYFTRENISKVEKEESSANYAVYFLFDQSEEENITQVYVGQSKNGINRMKDHNRAKDFWTYCIMFVTDNNSFDAFTIDYLEYYFIQKIKNSSRFNLENKEPRRIMPNISIYDRPIINSYISQIEFLLKAEGIDFKEVEGLSDYKFYYPRDQKYRGKIFVEDGEFVLAKDSIIVYPEEHTKSYNNNPTFYPARKQLIDNYLKEDKISEIEEGVFKTKINIAFDNPSFIATLMSGYSQNGWDFFLNLNELRKQKKTR